MSEKEIQAEIALCPRMLEDVPAAVLLIENGIFVYCNRTAVSIFHATKPADIVGKPPDILSPPRQPDGRDSGEKAFAIIQEALKGIPQRFEWVHKKMDGTPFSAEVTLSRHEIDGRMYLQTSIIDIEHRKKQRSDLMNMLNATTAAIFLIQDGVFTYCNKAALDMFRAKSEEDIIGQSPARFSPEVQPDGSISGKKTGVYIQAAMTGSPQRFEWSHQRLDGTSFEADVGLVRIEYGDKTYLQTTIFDISAQKLQIRQMENLSGFLKIEVDRLAKNLSSLSEGSTQLDLEVSRPDESATEAYMMFRRINDSLRTAASSISLMMEDTNLLTKSAQEGNLDIRADLTRHRGEFLRIIEGMNVMLDCITTPVREAYRISEEYSKLHYDAEFNPVIPVKGEFAHFKEALNTIGKAISLVMTNLKNEVESLSKNAVNARTGVDDVSKGAQAIVKNAEETAHNADRAQDGIDQVLNAMSDLTALVGEIAANSDEAARLSTETNVLAQKGILSAGDAEKGMESITLSSSEVNRIVQEIQNEMSQIRKIVNIITDIANQTNLLALNAAIEAARAGEAGRGFAVVAAEVKNLAQESRSSAESISDMIQTLEQKSGKAAVAIEMSGEAVNDGNKALKTTLEVFKNLSESVGTITEKMGTVARSIESQAASFEEITASAHEMSTLVKRTADDATHSAATSEEALAVVAQINSVIDAINWAVNSMNDEMKQFTIKK